MRRDVRFRPTFGVRAVITSTMFGCLVVACGSSSGPGVTTGNDGSPGLDSGVAEDSAAGETDGGDATSSSSPDSSMDSGAADGGSMDGASLVDTGSSMDSGSMDGASLVDTGSSTDSGSMDGGTPVEAGPPSCSPKCITGATCGAAGDCSSGVCTAAVCAAPACAPTCSSGTGCGENGDCASGVCTNGVCANAVCAPSCPDGHGCGAKGDCASDVCTSGMCAAPSCSPTCAFGAACGATADCASGVCTSGLCAAAACAPLCADTTGCGANTDCASGVCTAGKCAAPSCSPSCPDTNVCGANGDCASAVCTSGKCAPPSCSPACAVGNVCGANGDCASGACSGGTCQTTYTFGGTLAGLTVGESIVLHDQSGNSLTLSANGPFTMTVPVMAGTAYAVTVFTPPTTPIAQTCVVANGGGTIASTNVTNVTVDCDLLAYYPFTGNANDASGYGHNGVVTNATLTPDAATNPNSAYSFAGNGNISVTMPSAFLPTGDASRTLTAWIEPTQNTNEWGVVYYGTGNCNGKQFGIGDQNNTKATFWGGCDDDITGLSLPLNTWSFVAIVYSQATPTSVTMYVNATAVTGSIAQLATPLQSNLVMGADLINNASFTGKIDSVRVYGHALSAAEVSSIYTSNAP